MRKMQLMSIVAVLFSLPLYGDTIGVFNSGVDNSGNALPGGSADPHWNLVSVTGGQGVPGNPAIVLSDANTATCAGVLFTCSWVNNDATTKWISNVDSTSGFLSAVFEETFSLTGLDPSTAVLTGAWTSDNPGQAFLNGNLFSSVGPADFHSLHPFTVNSGFVAGVNKLDLQITGDQLLDGAFIKVSGTAAPVPEPSSLLLLVTGGLPGVGYLLGRRRLRKPR